MTTSADWYAELGRRIRAARIAIGMKSQDLASRVGIQPAKMSAIERGRRSKTITIEEFVLVRKALGAHIPLPPALW
jgi:transcriptional regulator with XRE-family HTH domain